MNSRPLRRANPALFDRCTVALSAVLAVVAIPPAAVRAQARPAPRPIPTFFEPLPLLRAKQQDAAEKAPAARPDPVARARQQREEQENARTQQYVQMLQPTLWAELNFVREICEIEPAQRPKIKEAGEESLLQAARQMAIPQLRSGRATPAGAAQVVRAGLTKALRETLSAEQFARYSEEQEHKTAHRKQATILSVVSRLEEILSLTTEQRNKLMETLDSKWQDDWEQWLNMHQYGNQYFPTVPDQHVTPHLTPEQRTVWQSLQKVNVNSFGGGGQRIDDGWWQGKPDDAGKARSPATKPAR